MTAEENKRFHELTDLALAKIITKVEEQELKELTDKFDAEDATEENPMKTSEEIILNMIKEEQDKLTPRCFELVHKKVKGKATQEELGELKIIENNLATLEDKENRLKRGENL